MIETFIMVVVRPGHEDEVYNALMKDGRVKEIYRVYGEYDILLRVEVPNVEELDKFHDEVLRKIKNIEMTETLIASAHGR
ncbi:Lrp/AsnC ligand binding domain-containing protein [Thermococcus sp.]|uniref:Lrp/AsnC ligand binding domain-containing protein n=1 Tax=Thermococcus sp. TaxID=35749 RepID=UPI002612FF77|nr:Lrp/AsnC ligand binding domain-containing protein [Thermococcus sp.]